MKKRLRRIWGIGLVLVLLVAACFLVAAPVSADEPNDEAVAAVATIEAETETSAQSALPGILIWGVALISAALITIFTISRRRHIRSPPAGQSAKHSDSTFDVNTGSGQDGRSFIGRIMQSLHTVADGHSPHVAQT